MIRPKKRPNRLYEPPDELPTDVQGSYTGLPLPDEHEQPVQDADDL